MVDGARDGFVAVLGIGDCPAIEGGSGRVVLGTFTSVSRDVYDLTLVGLDEPIEVTYGHPIWSLDRGDWVKAGELEIGERLATEDGEAIVEALVADPQAMAVYNLDVETDHRYIVGELAVVAHNVDPWCAKAPNAYWRSGKRVFPTKGNSGLGGGPLRREQLDFFRRGIAADTDPGVLRGQACEAGYTRLSWPDRLADRAAERLLQQAIAEAL